MKDKTRIFAGLALLVGLVLGLSIASRFDFVSLAKGENTVATPSSEGFSMEDAVINVASTTGKAVVSISTEHTTKVKGGVQRFYFNQPFGGGSPFGEDDPFRKFFEDFSGEMPDRGV